MKLLVISDRFPPYHEGGYGLKCQQIAEGLSGLGHDVTVLTTRYGLGSDESASDGKVLRMLDNDPWKNGGHSKIEYPVIQVRRAMTFRGNYKKVKHLLEELEPEAVLVYQMYDISLLPLQAVYDADIPCFFDVSSYWLLHFKDYFKGKEVLGRKVRSLLTGIKSFPADRYDNMIFTSEFVRKRYIKEGFDSKGNVVIHGGIKPVEAASTDTRRRRRKGNRLVFVGRLVSDKGAHLAVRSMDHIVNGEKRDDISLDIFGIGDREYIEDMKMFMESKGLEKNIHFNGEMLLDELLRAFTEYDVLLFPSTWDEPLGRVPMEAMAQGLPVVAFATGGTPEIIDHGKSGILVDNGDHVEMARSAIRIIDDPALRESMVLSGRERISKGFLMKDTVEGTAKHIEEGLLGIKKEKNR